MAFKMRGHSLPGPHQRDTSLTGGREENVIHGGQVSVWNPQYVPGEQIASDEEEEEIKKRNITRHIIRGSGRTHDSSR